MARARDVPSVEVFLRTGMEQHKVTILEMLRKPCRVDQQRSRSLRHRKDRNKCKCKSHHVNMHT